jgi:hypothetical protein
MVTQYIIIRKVEIIGYPVTREVPLTRGIKLFDIYLLTVMVTYHIIIGLTYFSPVVLKVVTIGYQVTNKRYLVAGRSFQTYSYKW